MRTQSLVPLAILATSIAAIAAPVAGESESKPLQVYPKNLARQHVGANLFLFNPSAQTYATTEAAAAWLDDDATTGWPIMAGKQFYLLALPEPAVVTNFAISARPAAGTFTIYAGDEPAAPGAKAWTPLAKDVAVDAINNKKLAHPFNRFAKYVLIETNIADPGPLFSLYLYSERPAVSYVLAQRDKAIDTKAIFGYVNDETAINHSGLALGSRVAFAAGGEGYVAWQKAIDDNPESATSVAPGADVAGLVLKFDGAPNISRVAVLTATPAKGTLDFFAVPTAPDDAKSVSLAGLKPTTSIALDGSTVRQAVDFPAIAAGALLVRWTPEAGADALAIRELNAFDGLSLSQYGIGMTPEAIAELVKNGDASKDGKSFKDGKTPEPVGELRQARAPYLPGSLGFPPIIPPVKPPGVSN